jgi:hypothetical protein
VLDYTSAHLLAQSMDNALPNNYCPSRDTGIGQCSVTVIFRLGIVNKVMAFVAMFRLEHPQELGISTGHVSLSFSAGQARRRDTYRHRTNTPHGRAF